MAHAKRTWSYLLGLILALAGYTERGQAEDVVVTEAQAEAVLRALVSGHVATLGERSLLSGVLAENVSVDQLTPQEREALMLEITEVSRRLVEWPFSTPLPSHSPQRSSLSKVIVFSTPSTTSRSVRSIMYRRWDPRVARSRVPPNEGPPPKNSLKISENEEKMSLISLNPGRN